MSVIVRIGRKKAILCAAKWRCADPCLEEQLQASLDIWVQTTGGPPIKHEDPDRFAAEAIRHKVEYEVLLSSRPKGRTARTAYLAKRQFRLPF